jgi:hypothetical protein
MPTSVEVLFGGRSWLTGLLTQSVADAPISAMPIVAVAGGPGDGR